MTFNGRRRWAAVGAVITTAVATAGIALSTPAGAAPGCRVDYTANNWGGGGGFGGAVKITNLGDPVAGWSLTFTFPGTQRVTHGWNATWTQSGAGVTARSMSWNGNLATGAFTDIGFNAQYLLDFLRSVDSSEVEFRFKDSNSAGELRPHPAAPETVYRYVVMPMRI